MTGRADAAPAQPRAVIASGSGRYSDPWHSYAQTSERLADVLRTDGWNVDIFEDPDLALAGLEGVDLLVVNAGDSWRGEGATRGANPRADAGLAAALERGIGLIAIHSALSSFRDYPVWRRAIGGEWHVGRSWHPEVGDATVRVVNRVHAIARDNFRVFDERYTDLIVDPGVKVLAVHDLDGVEHPVVWVHETTVTRSTPPVRAVVSALGHAPRAYESLELRGLLTRAARWAAHV